MESLVRVLALDDDSRFIENLIFALGDGFRFFPANRIADAEAILRREPIDVILLDFNLGRENGHAFIDLLRTLPVDPPIIVVSGVITLEMTLGFLKRRVHGFLEKPVSLPQLKEALTGAARRGPVKTSATCSGFDVDFALRRVSVHGNDVNLTPTEFEILALFLERRGRTVTRKDLNERLWGNNTVSRHTLDTHLLNLRKKVPPFAEKLVSVYGTGYHYED
ncbi:MAG TPA: response regulator transcription factor [Pseudobdellovibrionaceae bacterium]|nr:response regulator transcription factor [Pseudobdellovibrionaceae bacterium]